MHTPKDRSFDDFDSTDYKYRMMTMSTQLVSQQRYLLVAQPLAYMDKEPVILNALSDLEIGPWTIVAFQGNALLEPRLNELPRVSAIYVLKFPRTNYVGQSMDALRRVRHHLSRIQSQDKSAGTATLILNHEQEMGQALLLHIEFGLMLIHLGGDHQLISKQTELPFGTDDDRRCALGFFEAVAARFFVAGPHLLGSRSRRNRRAFEETLPYLRMIWSVG